MTTTIHGIDAELKSINKSLNRLKDPYVESSNVDDYLIEIYETLAIILECVKELKNET